MPIWSTEHNFLTPQDSGSLAVTHFCQVRRNHLSMRRVCQRNCCGLRPEPDFQSSWIQSHVKATNTSIKKPLLVEEFGKKLEGEDQDNPNKIARIRNPAYALTYSTLEEHIEEQSGGFVGTLFWRYYLPTYENQGRDEAFILTHTQFISVLQLLTQIYFLLP